MGKSDALGIYFALFKERLTVKFTSWAQMRPRLPQIEVEI